MLLLLGNMNMHMAGNTGTVTPTVTTEEIHIGNPMLAHVGRMMVRLIPFVFIMVL